MKAGNKSFLKQTHRIFYYGFAALVALALAGVPAFLADMPQWKTAFAYQSVGDDPNNSAATQSEVLRSSRFPDQIRAILGQEGFSGWSEEAIARSLHVTNPPHSALIQVSVQTHSPKASQTIAAALDSAYTSYLAEFTKDVAQTEILLVQDSLKHNQEKLAAGEKRAKTYLMLDPQLQLGSLTEDPDWGEKSLGQSFSALSQQVKEAQAEVALEETRYKQYLALLNNTEKNLIEGVIVGDDPVVEKLQEKMASGESADQIIPVSLGPNDVAATSPRANQHSLERMIQAERQKVLAGYAHKGKPVIRDSLRRNLVESLLTAKVNRLAATNVLGKLNQDRDKMLTHLDTIVENAGDYRAWQMQRTMLRQTISAQTKRLDELNAQLKHPVLPVRLLYPIPSSALAVRDTGFATFLFITLFVLFFGFFAAIPSLKKMKSARVTNNTVISVVKSLLGAKTQRIVMMIPANTTGHMTTAVQVGGMLNQFGRDTLVIDVDLSHRLLSRKCAVDNQHGVYEHLLSQDLKQPFIDPLSGAKVLPLEASLGADKVVEYTQIMQRIPRIWERWPGSVIILDLSQWHETYHQLLSYVSEVIFYAPPSQSGDLLLPTLFKDRYNVPVSLVEVQPEPA